MFAQISHTLSITPKIECTKGVPAKVYWYLPVLPRLRRLFSNPKDAELLQWHAKRRKDDATLRHPADSPQWRNIDRIHPEFASDPRNLRLGLCTDGMNPYGNMSSRHSTWPVLLCIYNLPPWLCMKRRYILMPLLISGPKQPGNDIDVYLAPLIEELQDLWRNGAKVWDAYKQEYFTLFVMIFCTINDFPAYGNLSGYKVKGAKACPICLEDTCSHWMKETKKTVYLGNRRFLSRYHPYRRKSVEFNGKVENGAAPRELTGMEIYGKVQGKSVDFGKGKKGKGKREKGKKGKGKEDEEIWKKKSIFWDLPYWRNLDVRHCLDGMHIIKNIAESLCGILFNIKGKTKDGINVRRDLVEMGIRPELAPQVRYGGRIFLPAACYTLRKEEKLSLLECLKSIKVPTGYSANISSRVSLKEMKLIGMKSHDWHVLLTQLLPVAIRGILPPRVRHSITKLCFFFNSICAKTVYAESLVQLQKDVAVTLCELEMFLPPSFFDIMVHLTIHLVREIRLCGPMFLRYMYPFERAMGQLKAMVRSRSKPEGSIITGTRDEEVIEYYTDYLEGVQPIGLPKSRHEGRLVGVGIQGSKFITPGYQLRQKALLKVLEHMTEVSDYVNDHLDELRKQNPLRGEGWIHNEHGRTFSNWFALKVEKLISESSTITETVKWLSRGPGARVQTWQGFAMNGYTWYTKQQDDKSTVQNSGVSLVALSGTDNTLDSYYGWIEEIWELDYTRFSIPLFFC